MFAVSDALTTSPDRQHRTSIIRVVADLVVAGVVGRSLRLEERTHRTGELAVSRQLRNRPVEAHRAIGHHDDAVACSLDLVETVARQEHRDTVRRQRPEHLGDRRAGHRVERTRRLVEQQQRRTGEQGPSE